jgi:signal transduction histidine kinase
MAEPTARSPDRRRPRWLFAATLAVAFVVWTLLVGGTARLLYTRTFWLRESDEANLREWLDEARIHRKALPEQVAEYLELRDRFGLPEGDERVVSKRQEIAEQLRRLADPTRLYQGQIPLFPDIYALSVAFPGTDWAAIEWASTLPKPRPQLRAVNELQYRLLGEAEPRAVVRCEYRLHAFNARQREAEEAQRRLFWATGIVALLLPAAALAAYRFWRHDDERRRALQEAELESARQVFRAASAEKAALELKSQIFASIGIMAGSYAHNIKNLLVRPNDLLARCLNADGLAGPQQAMLAEVRSTLGTVTERLQEILRTVRREPGRVESARIDVNGLIASMMATWTDLARDRWKIVLSAETSDEGLSIEGDRSHLVQALENLLFNARDAAFEMRNHVRDRARAAPGTESQRRQAILDAAAWKGRITFRTRRQDTCVVIEVEDNGIGMTDDVRRRCTETHFSTKRDNAVFEGYNTGTGLGLSFVIMVLDQHAARLEIDSRPLGGATIRAVFPTARSAP